MKSDKVDLFSRGAPWVRKFGHDVAYARTHLAVVERESGVSRPGGGVQTVCYNHAMHLCNPRFSWREPAQEIAWPSTTARNTSLALGKIQKWLVGRVILETEVKYIFSQVFAQSPLLPCVLHNGRLT